MIPPHAVCTIRRIPLEEIAVTEHQPRYWRRVRHYVRLLQKKRHAADDPGFLIVSPRTGGYVLQDGHHRYCALIICGRKDALCVVVDDAPPSKHGSTFPDG